MEAELVKENFLTSYPSANLTLNILAEGETIVPDIKKDIDKIIAVEGKSYIEKTEIQKNRILFAGTAEFTVLYTSEESDALNSVCAKIPFNHIEECDGVSPENKFLLNYETVHSECMLVNSRKISVKSVISVSFISYADLTLPLVTGVRSSEAEVKKEQVAFSHLTSCISESFTLSDFSEMPSSSEPPDTLLLTRTALKDCSFKAVSGKAVAKGTLSVFRIYLTPEGSVSHICHESPFTEILDIPGLSEDDSCDVSFFVKSFSEEFRADESSRKGFAFSAEITVSSVVFSTEKVHIIKDSYIPGMNVTVNSINRKKSEISKTETISLSLKDNVSIPENMPAAEQILPVHARITDVNASVENGKISLTGTIDAYIMYLYGEGKALDYITHRISFSEYMDSPFENPDIFIKTGAVYADFNFLNPSKLDLRCFADISLSISENTDSLNCIENILIGEASQKKRPSIVIYFVKSGDTLWDIAKKYSTTTEKILEANAMEKGDILNVGARLLIPA